MQSYSLFCLNIFWEFILDVRKFKRVLKEQKSVIKSTALVLKDIGLWKQAEGELLRAHNREELNLKGDGI